MLSATSLSFTATQSGALPNIKSVSITSSGAPISGLAYSVNYGSGNAWLTVSGASSVTPGSIDVRPNKTNLNPGTYAATITIRGTGVTPKTVSVTYVVQTAPTTGTLRIPFSGLPSGVSPNLTISTSSGTLFSTCGTGSNPCILNNVPAGSYTVKAFQLNVSGTFYNPLPASQTVTVTASTTATAQTVVFTP